MDSFLICNGCGKTEGPKLRVNPKGEEGDMRCWWCAEQYFLKKKDNSSKEYKNFRKVSSITEGLFS